MGESRSIIPILNVLGGFLCSMAYGSSNIWGNISIYVVSWIRKDNPSITLSNSFTLVPVALVFLYCCVVMSIRVGQKLGVGLVSLIGAIVLPLAVFLSSFNNNFFMFAGLYGVLANLAIGINFMIPYKVGWDHFPESKGRITGIISGGFGLSPLIFNLLTSFVVNPNNLPPDFPVREGEVITKYYTGEVVENVPRMLQVLAVCQCAIALVGTALLSLKKKTIPKESLIEYEQAQEASADNTDQQIVGQDPSREESTVKEEAKAPLSKLLCGRQFMLLFMFNLFGSLYTTFTLFYYKQLGLSKIEDDIFLSSVGSITSLFSSVTRPGVGLLMDRFGYKKCASTTISLNFFLSATILFILSSKPLYLFWNLMAGLGISGLAVTVPTEVVRIFGKDQGPQLSSIISFSNMIVFFILSLLSVFVLNQIGIEQLELIYCGFTAIGFLINLYYCLNIED
eukprot:TRINITY_DN5271_c0_g1_i3.p1 TRINITY_DN5271_c0_g1~~TRINITY_DN5271_c0_g1_i3.p1  ORF type:complete len:453 (-),score=100.82 TRINITY_DN5271_c0_g1_i3:498-1856(-)